MGDTYDRAPEAGGLSRRRRIRNRAARAAVASFLALAAGQALGAGIEAVPERACTPVAAQPVWGEAEIRASRTVHRTDLPARPAAAFGGVDMLNLFIVVEAGDHHVTVLDGDRFEPIHRFPSGRALHGGPKFTPDGRFAFFGSRDGWIGKFDLWNLMLVAEVRAGVDTSNIAVSADGGHVAVANCLPHTLVLLDADLNPLKVHPVRDKEGRKSSRVAAVYDAGPRQSFVAVLGDVPEVWEISYDPKADDVPIGVIHDFHYREGAFIRGYLNPRRSTLPAPLGGFSFTPDHSELLGGTREAGRGLVVNLDVRKKIADLDISGIAHPGAGISWDWNGRRVMASPERGRGAISVIDLGNWRTLKRIPTPGPGFFVQSHDATPYAWADSAMSGAGDTLLVIDKRTLERVAEVTPAPGRTLVHVEFTRDGKYALASLRERRAEGGAVVVLDAATFAEVKRIPMDKPVGKFNLYNRIARSKDPGR
ncbi:MAG: cytochrome C oxidase Cbb3 [Burkholderiales bacterium]|nr:MAG: cytochrome C oxidase Cbb3 [Burkholderiales bacterium]